MHKFLSSLRTYRPFFRILGFGLLAFTIYRICFAIFNRADIPVAESKGALFAEAFFIGLRFDLVTLCFILAPFLLALFVCDLLRRDNRYVLLFFQWYFIVIFSTAILICCSDIPYFAQFGTHLNKQFTVWLNSPALVAGLIFSNIKYWGFIPVLVIAVWLIARRIKKITSAERNVSREVPLALKITIFLVLGLLTFIGMRGRTASKSPIRIGTAFFSEHHFFNQLGLNPCFVFLKSLEEDSSRWSKLSDGYTEAAHREAVKLISDNDSTLISPGGSRIYTFHQAPSKHNVVIVLMESMAMAKMGMYGYLHLTRELDTLAKQGLFFTNFYSAGIHTFNGVFSTETGFPAIMDIHPLNTYTDKAFQGLSYHLRNEGYKNYFFTSHDAQFDNLEGFMKFNHFDRVYSQADYPWDKVVSTLGVSDEYLLNYAIDRMDEHTKASTSPFFSYILTSTDHTPYTLPEETNFRPRSLSAEHQATEYADWSIGEFIKAAKKKSWFNNTLFVFVADHGMHLGNTYSMPLAYNHIPCIFYMPSKISPKENHTPGGQIDVMPTVLSFLKIPFENRSMGINLLRETRPFMYFSADNKTGCIDRDFYQIHLYEDEKDLLYRYSDLNTNDLSTSMKAKNDSMRNYASGMIRAASYIIQYKKY